MPVQRALLSVSDKTGLADFAKGLTALGIEVISTGGTAKALQEAGIPVTPVDQVTGFPEMMEGRVKTLHPAVHGAILADRRKPAHMQAIAEKNIAPIDLVVVNLYPFEQTVAKPGTTLDEAIENIDIGGPSMVRSAAKNHFAVGIVVDPADYAAVLQQLQANDRTLSDDLRSRLALKAFQHTAAYDAAIARYLESQGEGFLPERLTLTFDRAMSMRYGENPHQQAAFYRQKGYEGPTLADATLLSGLELSFNNIQDGDAAMKVAMEFDKPACAIIKHTNPCGCATADDLVTAFRRAKEGDPVSAFGGIVAVNKELDDATAAALCEKNQKWDIILAPSFAPEALERFRNRKSWGQTVRLIAVPNWESVREIKTRAVTDGDLDLKRVSGGLLVQEPDRIVLTRENLKAVSQAQPTPDQIEQMMLAWKLMRHVKSNAIVIVKDNMLVGAGAGQMNRVNSVRLALEQAGERAKGAVLASDAFFPFPDGPEAAILGGVAAIIEPGGSTKDETVIAKCDEYSVPLVFTGIRHFKH
ncbi:MAG TPA: bifunctional phosphoribosylaminoimidazolecarboxamide formyltransferase/IMP cyclohydrolase [Armatimonadota bacterium]|jgi:phosphoribosylaminoimidazolecarboxamide formyltransferase/IMP cyclohydrolase